MQGNKPPYDGVQTRISPRTAWTKVKAKGLGDASMAKYRRDLSKKPPYIVPLYLSPRVLTKSCVKVFPNIQYMLSWLQRMVLIALSTNECICPIRRIYTTYYAYIPEKMRIPCCIVYYLVRTRSVYIRIDSLRMYDTAHIYTDFCCSLLYSSCKVTYPRQCYSALTIIGNCLSTAFHQKYEGVIILNREHILLVLTFRVKATTSGWATALRRTAVAKP